MVSHDALTGSAQLVQEALSTLAHHAPRETDGKWLEELTERMAPVLADWDIEACWLWGEWPDRHHLFPGTDNQDIGIDLVAQRRSDQGLVAVQCKSRKLEPDGSGAAIGHHEIAKFVAAAGNPHFVERWLVTNGAVSFGGNAGSLISMQTWPLKAVNLAADVTAQAQAHRGEGEQDCGHCDDPRQPQTRGCMQREAVEGSVRILREHAAADSGGLPKGQARGRIILPCGTGKTRIALRIVEELTPGGGVGVVLCPSIALVAQLRREFLQHAAVGVRALAVCSDQTAGYDPSKEGVQSRVLDPTADTSHVSASEIKGQVTTDPEVIADWVQAASTDHRISVMFGTYQSAGRIAEALGTVGRSVDVLVCDEAHRTASLRRKKQKSEQDRLREFTLCHDQSQFPARYRVYQTATPRIYNLTRSARSVKRQDVVVRSMDDETVFGLELYRRSYLDAVNNGWLADYRIIALGVNDPEAYRTANHLARETQTKGRGKLTTVDYLRGLALALVMSGGTKSGADDVEEGGVSVGSCIAFMNTVQKSKNMATDLQTETVRDWLKDQMGDGAPVTFTLEHLDATDNVARRDHAKRRLAEGSSVRPHGIINVGIFGEGTDSPSLSAVAFLEPRKSPIDVVQAVGRAMRTAPGKEFGYIICPILIPANAAPERWLSTSKPEEGWSELGQILLALRAHDSRIEENLADLLRVYAPPPLDLTVTTLVAVASQSTGRIRYGVHRGSPGTAETVAEAAAKSDQPLSHHGLIKIGSEGWADGKEPTGIVTAAPREGGKVEVRVDTVMRNKPAAGQARGSVNLDKSKKHARKMINNGEGRPAPPKKKAKKPGKSKEERQEEHAQRMLELVGETYGEEIWMNLLNRSGLRRDRVNRDLNILEDSIHEAAHHLREDQLGPALDQHFGLDLLAVDKRGQQADGSTTAALLIMNAAMLHQRIVEGRWLRGIKPLGELKSSARVIQLLEQNWERITRQDFLPVITPAREVIYAIRNTGRDAGLERALHHLCAEAERIAAMYADMGADHAGPLFNKVMGNQASDGAYFTRPPAATVAALLTLDTLGEDLDWTNTDTWRQHKTVDLACGSGTLLAALLTEMKNRARTQGASPKTVAALQKVAVEEQLKGMDINPVSLQLAATQLTAGNIDVKYRGMGLYQMPYGPTGDPTIPTAVGTLELLAEDRVVPVAQEALFDRAATGTAVRMSLDDPMVEDAAGDALGAGVVIMNPPFTNRENMGEKYPPEVQQSLRARVDEMGQALVAVDPRLAGFADKNNLRQPFVALADRCLDLRSGTLTMINPTVALTAISGQEERLLLADRFWVHTIVTCHQPGNINLSQNTNINESIIVLKRHQGPKPPTRIINLDRFPSDDRQAAELHRYLRDRPTGTLAEGWGEVSEWPVERIQRGDWSAAIWRSPVLAEASAQYARHPQLTTIGDAGLSPHATGQQLRGAYKPATAGQPHAFPILKSKGADAQQRIEAVPDERWEWKQPGEPPILQKAGHLLVSAGQDTSTARLTAVATEKQYVGNGWSPVTGTTLEQAKALAVFLNSTPGRLLVMRNPGRKLAFPTYSRAEIANLPVPDMTDPLVLSTLAACWERTRYVIVPQYRDGEHPVRQAWDEAVCDALGWDPTRISHLRKLLHEEPHVRGLGYGQYQDDPSN